MLGILALILLVVGGVLIAPELRRLKIPRYVHVLAGVIAVISGLLLWRGGALRGTLPTKALVVLIPLTAVYYFYYRWSLASRRHDDPASQHAVGHSDPDV